MPSARSGQSRRQQPWERFTLAAAGVQIQHHVRLPGQPVVNAAKRRPKKDPSVPPLVKLAHTTAHGNGSRSGRRPTFMHGQNMVSASAIRCTLLITKLLAHYRIYNHGARVHWSGYSGIRIIALEEQRSGDLSVAPGFDQRLRSSLLRETQIDELLDRLLVQA